MEHSIYNEDISRIRELKANGFFHEAAIKFEELWRSRMANSSELVLELADTLFLQGCFKKALDNIEEHLCQFNRNESQADLLLFV